MSKVHPKYSVMFSNQIASLPESPLLLRSLRKLNLSENNIRELPEAFLCELRNLEELEMSGNRMFTTLPLREVPNSNMLGVPCNSMRVQSGLLGSRLQQLKLVKLAECKLGASTRATVEDALGFILDLPLYALHCILFIYFHILLLIESSGKI